MTGVIPVIDTAYDLVMTISTRFVRSVFAAYGITEEGGRRLYIPERTSAIAPVEQRTDRRSAIVTPRAAIHGKHTVMYALAHETPLYKDPTIGFDSCIAKIPYGELVLVMEPQGRFYRVVWENYEGWVLKDNLADRAGTVYPEFVQGEENSVDHPNTAHVRALINDTFGLGQSEFPLQAGEYVLYRLMRRGIRIQWPETRPRTPGSWHTILRGLSGVYISVLPKQGTIIEYTEENDIGHLAYVEAVFPDGTVTISEANYPHAGIYNERSLSKEMWRSLRPVFIEVTA
jgi:hypothetical protein